jgi:hypothetical protein
MASVEARPRRYLRLGEAQTANSMQMTVAVSGECSRRLLLQLVGGNASEAEEREVVLLLRTLGERFERHAQLSESPHVVVAAVAVAVGLPLDGLP